MKCKQEFVEIKPQWSMGSSHRV